VISDIRQRWLPSGEQAIIATLQIRRPDAGADRANAETSQPLPLRATGSLARQLAALEGQTVQLRGYLRRRYYRRDGKPRWGQVEIWVEQCQPHNNDTQIQ